MSRYVSFVVLIAVILLLGIIFYRVMAAFILPLFLATVLVVVFGPVHKWVLKKTRDRKTLASSITTTIIGLAVILPVSGISIIAFGEARHLFKYLTSGGLEQNLKRIRKSLQLEIPAAAEFRDLEETVRALEVRNFDEMSLAEKQLERIEGAVNRLELSLRIPQQDLEARQAGQISFISTSDIESWREFRESVGLARVNQRQLAGLIAARKKSLTISDRTANSEENVVQGGATGSNSGETQAGPLEGLESSGIESLDDLAEAITEAKAKYRKSLDALVQAHDRFRLQVLGGSTYAYFKEMANPSNEEFEKYNTAAVKWIRENFLSLGGRASQFLIGVIVNGVIMMISVFFFLADGSKMIAAIKFFSPLDDRHEQQLINEFGIVSRAVMVATLTAAAVQGVLAGIGYYLAGVEAVFLLALLTGFLAMVPFVGAASVWIPTCFYLYLIDDRLVPALLLAIWGTAVVSQIDNFIKPYILHGQSNIHPLLALLSVLGGVSALGPIGILVGPMVVAFLQTLLAILQREIKEMDVSSFAQAPSESEPAQEESEISLKPEATSDAGEADQPSESDSVESMETDKQDGTSA